MNETDILAGVYVNFFIMMNMCKVTSYCHTMYDTVEFLRKVEKCVSSALPNKLECSFETLKTNMNLKANVISAKNLRLICENVNKGTQITFLSDIKYFIMWIFRPTASYQLSYFETNKRDWVFIRNRTIITLVLLGICAINCTHVVAP